MICKGERNLHWWKFKTLKLYFKYLNGFNTTVCESAALDKVRERKVLHKVWVRTEDRQFTLITIKRPDLLWYFFSIKSKYSEAEVYLQNYLKLPPSFNPDLL